MKKFILLIVLIFVAIGLVYHYRAQPGPSIHYLPGPVPERKMTLQDFPVKKGGVPTLSALLAFMAIHPDAYPDIDKLSLHPFIVQEDFWAYSQYYRNGKMLWTKKKTLVRTGTLLFCDNYGHCVNSLCANELSIIPREPVDVSIEPIDTPIEMTPIPIVPTPTGENFPFPPAPPGVIETPPPADTPPTFYPPIFSPCCGGSPPHTPGPPVSVSEASTSEMLLIGLFMLLLLTGLKFLEQRVR